MSDLAEDILDGLAQHGLWKPAKDGLDGIEEVGWGDVGLDVRRSLDGFDCSGLGIYGCDALEDDWRDAEEDVGDSPEGHCREHNFAYEAQFAASQKCWRRC